MPTDLPGAADALRSRPIHDSYEMQIEALLLADECFIRMVVFAAAAVMAAGFSVIWDWTFGFIALLFAGAWVAAAQSREFYLRSARGWQKYIDDMENSG